MTDKFCGQGRILGRGKHRTSLQVIDRVNRANIVRVATPELLIPCQVAPVPAETGDETADGMLEGCFRGITVHWTRPTHWVSKLTEDKRGQQT